MSSRAITDNCSVGAFFSNRSHAAGLVVMVSTARPGNRQPYRAIVAWDGAPDHYWSVTFAFDCSSRSMSRVDSEKRRWHRRYKADETFPVADTYRTDFSSLVAPVICDGQTGTVSRSSEKALELAHGSLKPAN